MNTSSKSTTDRVEKNVTIKAPVSRVWKALTDSAEFSKWFGFKLNEPFVVGKRVTATFDEVLFTQADMDKALERHGLPSAPIQLPDSGTTFCTVEKIEPERYFAFRWIPFGIDAAVDPVNEPTTLVEFFVEAQGAATKLRIVESGFDRVPAHRRERAFRMNDGGWAAQAENIKRYVEGT